MKQEAVLYARFSPRRNAADCESCETQLERCRDYCRAAGLAVVAEHRDEGLSGARADNRPGLQAAIAEATRRGAVLVVYALSRLARSTKDAIELSERINRGGANLASLTERIDTTTPSGRAFFSILAAIDQLERETIAQRTKDAMLHHQGHGRRMSDRTPYGLRRRADNPAWMEEDEEEQAIIREIVRRHAAGDGLRMIGRELAKAGKHCRGGVWHHGTIRRILDRAG